MPISAQRLGRNIDQRVPPIVHPFPKNPDPQTAAESPEQAQSTPSNSTEEAMLGVSLHTTRINAVSSGEVSSIASPSSDDSTPSSETPQTSEVPANSTDGSASLPSHLANLTPEEREALQRRMTREMAIDEARNSEPRRKIDRNAKQLYCSAIGTSTFLILLVLKIEEGKRISWPVIFIPLYFQYSSLFFLSLYDIQVSYKSWLLHRQAAASDGIVAWKKVMSLVQETLWHATCLSTVPMLAQHLQHHKPGLIQVFIPVWIYGAFAVVMGATYLGYGCWSKFAHENPCRLIGSLNGVAFALVVRVLPVILVINKILGADYSWAVVFIPLWVSIGSLALVGCCVCCVVPVLVFTQEAAGRILGWIIGLAAAMMLIPAACTLTFLVLLVEHLQSKGEGPPLLAVVVPLIVMNILLAVLTPMLVKIVNSTNNVLDAMNNTAATVDGETTSGGKRPGVESSLADAPEMVFRQQTATLFKRVLSDVVSDNTTPFTSTDPLCYVCCEKNRDSVLQPCGHGGLCYDCAVEIAQSPPLSRNEQDSLPKCPLCRASVTEVLRLGEIDGSTQFVAKTSWKLLGNFTGQTTPSEVIPDVENQSQAGGAVELVTN